MRYLSIVSVLPTVDGGGLEKQTGVSRAKQCTAVDGVSSKTHFSHLEKAQQKKSISV